MEGYNIEKEMREAIEAGETHCTASGQRKKSFGKPATGESQTCLAAVFL